MALVKLKKSQFIIFLDTAKDKTFVANTWTRIDKSTIFDLAYNPQTTSNDYIDSDMPEEEVDNYQPELPQEIVLVEGNPMYDFISEMAYDLPTGEEVKVPYLLAFGGSTKRAWRGIATILVNNLNSVEGKISFTIKFNTIDKGTYETVEGKPVFTKADEVVDNGDDNGDDNGEAQG